MATDKELRSLAEKIALDLTNLHLGNATDAHWPFSINFMAQFCIEETVKSMYGAFCAGENQENRISSMISRLKYPSKLTQYFYLLAGSRAFLSESERNMLAKTLLKIICEFREDPLCLNYQNKIKGFDANKIGFEDLVSSNVKKLNFALQNYLELIIPTIMPLAREFHGPYNLPDGQKLIVKDYHTLLPDFLRFQNKLKCKKVLIYEIYKGNTPKFDFFNHLVSNNASSVKSFVFIDSKNVAQKEIDELIQDIELFIKEAKSKEVVLFVENFAFSIIDSFAKADSTREVKDKITKKIKGAVLEEKRINPYAGMGRDEIYSRLLRTFLRAFAIEQAG